MKRILFLLLSGATLLTFLVGCTSFRLRKQLDDQLSQGDRFYVEIVDFDAGARLARVRLIDRTRFTDVPGNQTVHAYRYDGLNWVEDRPQ